MINGLCIIIGLWICLASGVAYVGGETGEGQAQAAGKLKFVISKRKSYTNYTF